jgi:hypothetical protein
MEADNARVVMNDLKCVSIIEMKWRVAALIVIVGSNCGQRNLMTRKSVICLKDMNLRHLVVDSIHHICLIQNVVCRIIM